ncbi:MAG: hypothetical protein RIC30_09480 [Marinoscillum sp.]|uniref:hypothetical protein n=1 Tax=Marinoscillum sp. TaxID=2024838 RepID=UPI0032FCB84D
MRKGTFEFKTPSAEEYALLEAGIMRILFIPLTKIDRADLYEEDKARKFETVIVKSPSGRKHLECDHLLTDIAKPGFSKAYERNGKEPYRIDAVQHMYRVHVKLKTTTDEPGADNTQDAD